MIIPASLLERIEAETGLRPAAAEPLGGGSINRAARLTTPGGTLFLKWNEREPKRMFRLEADGLELLRTANSGLRIPSVIAVGDALDGDPGFLLLEYIEPATGDGNDFEQFGSLLAGLHGNRAMQYGLDRNNYIGRLPQSNTRHDSWTEFFIRERIEPQIRSAVDHQGLNPSLLSNWERLASRLDEIFPVAEPSLIHGDLWGGNFLFDQNRQPVLIDPAVYYGHPEMELAFTRMFGGFSESFYRGYEQAASLAPDFSNRVEIYNLYPLLVHANLFGGSYLRSTETFLQGY